MSNEINPTIDIDLSMSIVESFLFTFSEPVDTYDLVDLFKSNSIDVDIKYIENIIKLLEQSYLNKKSGLQILRLENKYQLVTKKSNFEYLKKAISPQKKKSLTNSVIETLTIIAYNQPTTKAFVEKIKGVKSDTAIAKLLEAGMIEECGRLDKIGRPIIYKTTDLFLKHLGINSIDELPKIHMLDEYTKEIDENSTIN